ncbi:hypothetical protein QAD02_022122 [Eretmocerus hayati]|uniref:Uncharacterized protein n=1 Tax=Eretmocerus hayati TaxID=131215 RepID=A0ACC2PT90_9HYME|nr:hypothetical protein QAD02_022122 [Eretmocerus hayati]
MQQTIFSTWFMNSSGSAQYTQPEKKGIEWLRGKRKFRPFKNASIPTEVHFDASLRKIVQIDPELQIMLSTHWLTLTWYDETLKWSPEDAGGMTNMVIQDSDVWRPKIDLHNEISSSGSASDSNREKMDLVVSHHGEVKLFLRETFRTSCPVTMTWFPFDTQSCSMIWGPRVHHKEQIQLKILKDGVDLSNYQVNGEFELVGSHKELQSRLHSCCPFEYHDITYNFELRRRPLKPCLIYMMPVVLAAGISITSCFMPPKSTARIRADLTSIFIMVMHFGVAGKSIPFTGSLPYIWIFNVVLCIGSLVSLLYSVFILRKRSEDGSWRRNKNL